jgi:hypothetical protein
MLLYLWPGPRQRPSPTGPPSSPALMRTTTLGRPPPASAPTLSISPHGAEPLTPPTPPPGRTSNRTRTPSFSPLYFGIGPPDLCALLLASPCERRPSRDPAASLSTPHVTFSTAPTVGAPPLTENLAVPPTQSPLLGESHHHAPSSLPLQLSSALTSPSLS